MSQKQAAQAEEERNFSIQRIYTKDISFETPNSPAIFTEDWQPETTLNLNTDLNDLGKDNYEVILSVTVTTKIGDKVAFLVEVQQAGIFLLQGFSKEEFGGMVGAYCPNILFPYVREVVSDLVIKGSFPQLILAPVNFDALYAQHLQQAQQPQGDEDEAPATSH
jgi:preprotein translocase subunit SecB